jgi:UPF0755 protein
MKRKILKITLALILFFFLAGAGLGGFAYYKINSPFFGISNPVDIYIHEDRSFSKLMSVLESEARLKNRPVFEHLASFMHLPENIKTGKYRISPEATCLDAIRMFRSGQQIPVRITFNNVRLKEDFAERIGKQLIFGPQALSGVLNNPVVCESFGFDTLTIACMFIPNTYEMYWNITVDNFLERMKKEYDRFWTQERLEKAKSIPLSPVETAILASIVEEETAAQSEYPVVAGLYINRLRKGMLLQADPTVKFAVGDVTLRRILFSHLEVDSPYNTYKNPGLPPGPIRIPSVAGIDAVLNYAQHHYLFMVAKEDFSGKHNFATTLSEHTNNAKKYQAALNRNNIY